MIIDLAKQFDCVKINGRSMQKNGITADWTASGIEFNAECKGKIFVTFKFESDSRLFFSSFVDGVKNRICVTDFKTEKPNIFKAEIACDLKFGHHTVLLEKQTEAERGCCTITEIELDGFILKKPELKKTFIEFIGDSITAGYGNLAPGSIDPTKAPLAVYEDGSDSFAAVAARELNADFSTICRQGTGIVNGWDSPVNPFGAIFNAYEHISLWRDTNALYDFSRHPDIVVVNLGTNDTYTFSNPDANHGVTDKMMIDGIYDRFCLVAKHNPDAKIVWAFGMMTDRTNFAYAYKWFDDAILRFEKDFGRKIYICDLPKNTDGGKGHPSVAGHKAAGIVLAEFLKKII